MPFIRITVSGPTLASNQVSLLQVEMTELMASVLGKRTDLASVLVEQAASAGWAIGGTPAKIAVHVDATITAGTNSAQEKARFIEKNHETAQKRPWLRTPSCDLRRRDRSAGKCLGYDGRTQESRQLAA